MELSQKQRTKKLGSQLIQDKPCEYYQGFQYHLSMCDLGQEKITLNKIHIFFINDKCACMSVHKGSF